MKIVIRIISLIFSIAILWTLSTVLQFYSHGWIGILINKGLFGVMTVLGWILTLTVGPFVAVQLWRFKHNGRLFGIALFGYATIYYLAGIFLFRTAGSKISIIIVSLLLNASGILLLNSNSAKSICKKDLIG